MACMPKVAREKIFLARCIHCCPNFSQPTLLYYEEYVCIYMLRDVICLLLGLLPNDAANE
jgi:hypothetical protein